MAAAPRPGPASLEEVTAASVRVLRAAIGNLASQFGYSRDTLNAILLALGADPADLETMRVFLSGREQKDGETT